MSKPSANTLIRLRGVRHNNLKNFDLDLPTTRLIVVTGPSGSGKSSLAFDTLYAEGQRRYIETFSPYARQFFDRMDKPQVDSIQGIPPAIAIEQRNTVKSTRSTVGTMTEICDYMKLVWSHLAELHCRQCGQPVRKDSPQEIWESLSARQRPGTAGTIPEPTPSPLRGGEPATSTSNEAPLLGGAGGGFSDSTPRNASSYPLEVLVVFQLPLSSKLSVDESLALIAKQGYQRLLLDRAATDSENSGLEPQVIRLEEAAPRWGAEPPEILTIVQDRLKVTPAHRSRFVEACEAAYHFGKGKLAIHFLDGTSPRRFSNRVHCAGCDLEYREPTPALFSFNHPLGACPTCRGFGRTITIDYDLAIPDRSLSLAQGAIKPWQTGQSAECQDDMMKFCRLRRVPTDVPFAKLPPKWQDWVLNGDPGYGKDAKHEWPRAWYGVKGYFRWLESKAYKMHVRVLLSRYRAYQTCADCGGRRFQPDVLLFKVAGSKSEFLTLADFYRLSVREALRFIEHRAARERNSISKRQTNGDTRQGGPKPSEPAPKASDPLTLVLNEVRSRLGYLDEVGLGYLTLDRATRTLSGGETERVNLTTCLGSRLVNTLFVLDEPSVGLHARDIARLVRILQRLREAGNTVVVVEHEASVIRAADQIVDLGPGHGETGGHLVFQGTFPEILKATQSLTGLYLSGKRRVEIPARRAVKPDGKKLTVFHACRHNLRDLTVEIPLGRFVCITGVSGSGKTTLVRDVLLPSLEANQREGPKSKVQSPKSDEDDPAVPAPFGRSESLAEAVGQASSQPMHGASSPHASGGRMPPEPADKMSAPHLQTGSEACGLSGGEHIGRVVLVDQSPLGKTPRSNPAVYIGAFDHIRELFAQSELAQQRGLNASAFSFNSAQGQCERCRGAGFEKIEMQFLSDVFIRCPDCQGRRYRPHIREIKLMAGTKPKPASAPSGHASSGTVSWSIADLLEATVEEVIRFLSSFPESRAASRAVQSLRLLEEVGLGYLRLGQPINTLSGGESQRLKLVSHLAEFAGANAQEQKSTLFLFDEPTTGLHFDDVRVLLAVFQRLVDGGHSVLVIEHNLDVIKTADWLIDLGPEAGDQGGEIVAQGTPEEVAACPKSQTGQALREFGFR